MVVVMRGVDPAPGAAQRRELRRLLQSSATPLLGDAAGIVIDRPRVRLLRLSLALRVATLDDAGEAASGARRALLDFFDSASGGVDGAGWPLGTAPAEDDIAYALEPVPGITGLADVDFAEIGADGAVLPWRPTVRPDELVMLAEDGLRF